MSNSFFSNLLGGLFGGTSASSAVSYAATRAGLELQHKYNKELASNQFGYTKKLNQNTYDLTRQLMNYQYNLERQSRQTSFVDTRKDLETAGYNPLLALGQQSGYVNVGASATGNSFSMPTDNSIFSAVSTAADVARTRSDIQSSKYTNDLNLALAEKARSEARGQDINNIIQDRTGLTKSLEEIELLKKQGLLSEKQANYYQKQIAVADSEISLNSANAQLARSSTVLNQQEATMNAPEVRFSQKHPVAHATLRKIGNPVGAVGSLAGIKYMLSGNVRRK